MTASNEGMTGPKEGVDPHDHHQMDRVLQAKETIGKKPNHKQASRGSTEWAKARVGPNRHRNETFCSPYELH
jgi:hypothetical protein